ncbi:benzoate/H(+) symporter BenE family transporter [uncultured Friedmanniella sp.]|uniref:benzoate/H(+) symporter BenE family transporter n=1 Tax=uncultured Friedmanniella sp. TaxID=335381 RepID=UPI0035CAC651
MAERGHTLGAVLAGVVTAVVGFSSSFALVLTGLTAQGASTAQAASGLLVLCLGMAVGMLVLALRYRMPLVLAWSTPGAALLAGGKGAAGDWPAAVGAFLVVAGLTALTGWWPWLSRRLAAIPGSIANAMLAGVLLPICVTAFTTLGRTPRYAAPILITWLVGYALLRRWAVPLALVAALVVVALTLDATPTTAALLPQLTWTTPVFDWRLVIGLAVPLFLVNIASQYAPGVAVLGTYGYRVPWRPTMLVTAGVSAAAAPFGGHAVNLAAISAALAASPETHPDPRRRWIAAVAAAGSNVLLGLASAAAAFVLTHSPPGLVITVAALALLGPLGAALERCLAEPDDRVAAVVALVATASGISLFGVGAAFWGLTSGLLVRAVLRWVATHRSLSR